MLNIEIQAYHTKYLKDILTCWNESLPYDLVNEQRFTDLVLLDDNFDKELFKVAILDKEVVGFCYGIHRRIPYLERGLEPERGWISIMAVKETYRRQGIGTQLVHACEKSLHSFGHEDITLCAYSPNYFTPGIDIRYESAIAFFEKLGYPCTGDAVSMQRDLWTYKFPEETKEKMAALAKQGIHIVPYAAHYLQDLLDFLLINFGAGWKRNALLAMQKQEAEETILLCVNAQDEILGFCMRKIDGNDGRFGPFGVNEELRSHGLGGVLFECMMQDMRKRGIYYTYLLWTSGDAKRFYERHHVYAYRTYRLYRRNFSS